jgi:prevent-host-death family protein
MRTLSVSSARSNLPSLIDAVLVKHESIVISRKGKPVAQLVPVTGDSSLRENSLYSLRSVPLSIPDDFDEPLPELWEALAIQNTEYSSQDSE